MKQFILKSEQTGLQADCQQVGENIVKFKGNDYHYLVNVRRLKAGDVFPALLPNGEETLVQVLSTGHGVLTGKYNAPEASTRKQGDVLPPIILFQAIPKGDKMDLIVRQAVEGGITEIVPFVSEYSIAKIADGMRINSKGQKFLRWERIIKEARQQSGSKITTTLHQPLTVDELFDYWKELREKDASNSQLIDSMQMNSLQMNLLGTNSLGLIFHHQKGLEQESLHEYLNSIPSVIAMAIGPEGGFSEREVSLFLENGFKPLTIGDTVLRTETAALYCAAAIRILLWEKDSWKLKQAKSGSE
jgi:16S rRNA (uracil1498-N3)-methyltransferase